MGWEDEILFGYMGNMTKMAAMPIYDKDPSKLMFFLGNQRAGDLVAWIIAFWHFVQHCLQIITID